MKIEEPIKRSVVVYARLYEVSQYSEDVLWALGVRTYNEEKDDMCNTKIRITVEEIVE